MDNSNDSVMTIKRLKNRKGLSLMELIVVTVVIAVTACMAFPVYKIFQQRSKEKRLKKVLTDVRAAISGSKSHNSTNDFQEGFRTVARVKGMELIASQARYLAWDKPDENKCVKAFIAKIGQGYGYPNSPEDIWSADPQAGIGLIEFDSFVSPYNMGTIRLERRFFRSKPIHPFHDWYPSVDFEYVPVIDNTGNPPGTTYTVEGWNANSTNLFGVKDIVTRRCGLALDGSDTDAW